MNSIQFITNQVDRVIGTPPASPRRSASTNSIYPSNKTSAYSDSTNNRGDKSNTFRQDESTPLLPGGMKRSVSMYPSVSLNHLTSSSTPGPRPDHQPSSYPQDDEEKKQQHSDIYTIKEHLILRVLLFIPRLLYRLILAPFVWLAAGYQAIFNTHPQQNAEQQQYSSSFYLTDSNDKSAYKSIFGSFFNSLSKSDTSPKQEAASALLAPEKNSSSTRELHHKVSKSITDNRSLFNLLEDPSAGTDAVSASNSLLSRSLRSPYSSINNSFRPNSSGDSLSGAPAKPSKRRVKAPIAYALRYPRALAPPRPLLSLFGKKSLKEKKTLVLDLDETLIHSLSRSTGFSQGHMVEVKLQNSSFATLYNVLKRPYCDEFLEKVSQWYNLVIFTASVQAYADPMIDWLEKDRKYFCQRFYRQHCTLHTSAKTSPSSTPSSSSSSSATTNPNNLLGSLTPASSQPDSYGYIKDLTRVEPDLSKVLLIDNSPVSYLNQATNAIGIEGWINDPSDNCLLTLIPLLSALRFSTDVRSILGLKSGEAMFM